MFGCYRNQVVTPIFLNKAHRRILDGMSNEVCFFIGLHCVLIYLYIPLQTTFPVDSDPTSNSSLQDLVTEGGDSSSQPVPPGPSLLASPLFPVAAVLIIVFVAFLMAIVIMLIIRKCLVVSIDKFDQCKALIN